MVVAIAITESTLDYNTKHKINSIKGICGIDTKFWKEELKENNIKVNSLQSCLYVYEVYYNQTNNKAKAIKLYKGIRSKDNYWIIKKVIKIENSLK